MLPFAVPLNDLVPPCPSVQPPTKHLTDSPRLSTLLSRRLGFHPCHVQMDRGSKGSDFSSVGAEQRLDPGLQA